MVEAVDSYIWLHKLMVDMIQNAPYVLNADHMRLLVLGLKHLMLLISALRVQDIYYCSSLFSYQRYQDHGNN
jgi:hypothetical protein